MFDEQALYDEIVARWGAHGAHADVFRAMRDEIQRLKSENDDLKETIRYMDYDMHELRSRASETAVDEL